MAYSIYTGSIIAWLYPSATPLNDYVVEQFASGEVAITYWNADTIGAAQPTDAEIGAQEKPWAAAIKREEIYREQELRSRNVMGATVIPRDIFAFIEEFYSKILLPAARNNITEANTPKTWGLKQLRDNRDTLLSGLQTWINDPAKTADDILAFDVAGWSGWTIARPE